MTRAQWVIILQMCTLSQPRQFVIFGICVLGKGTPMRARSLICFSHTLSSTHADVFHLQLRTLIFGICVLEKGARVRARALSLFLCLSLSETKRQRTREREREREKETEWGRERKRTLSLSLSLPLSLSLFHTCNLLYPPTSVCPCVFPRENAVSFAEYCLFFRALFQKRPII